MSWAVTSSPTYDLRNATVTSTELLLAEIRSKPTPRLLTVETATRHKLNTLSVTINLHLKIKYLIKLILEIKHKLKTSISLECPRASKINNSNCLQA